MKKIILLFLTLFCLAPFVVVADTTADYNTQYQAVQAKVQPLQAQFNQLQSASSSSPCSSLGGLQGQSGIQCTLYANQAGAVAEYEGAILKDFFTPVTSTSISYENQLDGLHQQIFQIKMDYYQQVANIQGTAGGVGAANGETNNATNAANAKIDALNEQIQTTLLEYQSVLSQQPTCPANSYVSGSQCACDTGYQWDSSQTSCVLIVSQPAYSAPAPPAPTPTATCPQNSYYSNGQCSCNTGFQVSSDGKNCYKILCPPNAALQGSQCVCGNGYIMSNDSCITYTQDCINNFGQNVSGTKGNNNNSTCNCSTGYEWNDSQTACIPVPVNSPQSGASSTAQPIHSQKNSSQAVHTKTSTPVPVETSSPAVSSPVPTSGGKSYNSNAAQFTAAVANASSSLWSGIVHFVENLFSRFFH